jgi:small-conductance mechanosensitive channel
VSRLTAIFSTEVLQNLKLDVDLAANAMSWLVDTGTKIVLILAVAFVARWLLRRVINRFVDTLVAQTAERRKDRRTVASRAMAGRVIATATGLDGERQGQRARTIGSLLSSVSTFVIGVITLLTILGVLGIPLAPLLTSAGVGGIAVGFGAQSLVRDFMSGIFMILEDQYGVGDIIDTGEAIGTVEEVTLRITRVRDIDGVTWYVRNGEIVRIGNYSQGTASAVVDVPFSSQENVSHAIDVMKRVGQDMKADEKWSSTLIDEPSVLGVESMTAGTTTVRMLASCTGGTKWEVQRELRRRIKEAFDEEGIQGPEFPNFPAQS